MYDRFICDLETETKLDCGYAQNGLLAVASGEAAAGILPPALRMAEQSRF